MLLQFQYKPALDFIAEFFTGTFMRNIFKGFILIILAVIFVLLIALSVLFLTGNPEFVERILLRDTASINEISEEASEEDSMEASEKASDSVSSEDFIIYVQPDDEASDINESELHADNTAKLAFAGDVMFSDAYLRAYDQSGISAIADSEMLKAMQEADLFILNEEFPFSLRGEPMADKQFTFRTDPKYVQILKDLGADVVTLANNHALDFGRDAFCDTLETLDNAGIKGIGGGYNISEASAPAVFTVNGQSFAIFGATRVSPSADWYAGEEQSGLFQTYEPSRLNAAIKEAKKNYDNVIVFVHWGIEKKETPEDYQRTLAKGYIDSGADLIVGCHPHVLQGFEYYNGVPIIYSLGNYLFDNRTGETLLLEADFSGDSASVKLIPCQRSDGVLKRMQNPSELYQRLTGLSYGVSVDNDGFLQPQS